MAQAMEEEDDAAVRRLLNGAVEAFKPELRNQGSMMHLYRRMGVGALKFLISRPNWYFPNWLNKTPFFFQNWMSMPILSTIYRWSYAIQAHSRRYSTFLLPFTTGWTYARVISQAAEYLEKKKQHKEANELLELLLSQKLYCTGSRGRWADRLALNYDHHLKRKDKVEHVCCCLATQVPYNSYKALTIL